MPRKVTTRRQRKAAAARKEAEKGAQKYQAAKQASANQECRVIIDENLAKHMQPPPPVCPPEVETITSKDEFVKKKAAKYEAPERTRSARKQENALDKTPNIIKRYEKDIVKSSSSDLSSIDEADLLEEICKDLKEILTSSDEEAKGDGLCPDVDCSTSATLAEDPGPVPPKFFGNTGYFMLTGTNSQLMQQLKDLAAKNINLESHVLLPNAMADIVEHQMTELTQNRDKILEKIRNKYDLIAQRRVTRQKKQRKCPKKKNED